MNIKYLKEAIELDEKKRKKKYDSELPWTGLNWGEDKGKGINTFNHLNGTGFSGATGEAGGCFEGIDLDEDRTRSIDEEQLIAKTFAGKVLKSLVDAQEKGGIQNIPNIEEFVKNSLKSKPVSLPELRPSTRSLVITSNTRGAGSKEAEDKKEVVHHVLALTGDGLDDIQTTLTLQNNTRLHNATVSKLKDKIKSEISDIVEVFKKLSSKVVRNINKETSDEELMRLQTILYYLQAWAIREIFNRVSKDKDYLAVYQQLLSQQLNEYIVSHPELVLSKLDKPVTIKVPDKGDYKVKIVINTIGKDQRNSLHRYMSGNVLKDFPYLLDNDFIVAEIVDGPDSKGKVFKDLDEFREFFRLAGTIEESLNEANEEFKVIPTNELRKCIEHNLMQEPLYSEYKDGKTQKSPFYNELYNIISHLNDKKESSESRLIKDINTQGERNKELWTLKQKAVAELVRDLFNSHNFKLKYKGGKIPFNNLKYRIKIADTIVNKGEDFKLVDNPEAFINIEDIFKYIDGNRMVELNISDPHFLDGSGNPVQGIKTKYDDKGNIVDLLINPDCDTASIYTVISDRPTSGRNYLDTIKKFKGLGILVIDEKDGPIIPDSVYYSSNTIGKFSGLYSVEEVQWLNPKSTTISGGCFRNIGCDKFIIPDCVTRIGDEAFAYSSLQELYIPKSVKYLGDSCFTGCDDLVLKFEIKKEDIPKYAGTWYHARLLSGDEQYKGLDRKWGKSSVKKIIWGVERPKTESLEEDLLTEDIAAVRDMFKEIPEDKFFEIVKLDPTYIEGRNSVGKYTKWLLNLYKKSLLKDEDLYKIPDLLKEFEEKRRWMTNKDIQQFKGLGELADALSKVEVGELSDNAKQKAEHKKLAGMDLSDINAEKVFEDNDWVVYIPKDFEASRKLSSISNSAKGNNRWCTGISARDSQYFDKYTKDGPLYIIINKHDPQEESYQFHFESEQFMNKNDNSIALFSFLLKNPGLYDFFLNKLGKFPATKKSLEDLGKDKLTKQTMSFPVVIDNIASKDETTKLIFNAIASNDYETLLDIYGGLELPEINEFRSQVHRIGIDEEVKALLNKLGISEEEYNKAIDGDGSELSVIIEEAILTSLKRNILDQIKVQIGLKIVQSNPIFKEFEWGDRGFGKVSIDKSELVDNYIRSRYEKNVTFGDAELKSRALELVRNIGMNMSHVLQHGEKPWRPELTRLNKAKYLKELKDSLRYQL